MASGVESVAILFRWFEEPSCRDFDLEILVVITPMTGKEWSDTQHDFENHVLPRFREYGVRFVQAPEPGIWRGRESWCAMTAEIRPSALKNVDSSCDIRLGGRQ